MGQIKLDREEVETIKWLCIHTDLKDGEIAKMFGVSRKHINSIRNKQRWKNDYRERTQQFIRDEIVRRTRVRG